MKSSVLLKFMLLCGLSFCLSLKLNAQSGSPDEDPNAGLKILDTQIFPYEGPAQVERKLIVKIQLKDGFKAYSHKFLIHILDPYPVEEGNLEIGPVHKFYDKFSKTEKEAVMGQGTLSLPFYFKSTLKNGENKIKYELKYQICTESYCYFPKTLEAEIPFVVQKSSDPNDKNLKNDTSPSLMQETFLGAKERGSLYLFIFVFLAGVLTSLTPCLLPILPLTLAVLGKGHLHDKKWLKFFHAVVYVLGVASTYSVLGLLAASSGSIFGATLSNPIVQIVFALLFIFMGVAQFGLFEIQTPLKLQNTFHKLGHNTQGIFLTGLISGLVASPCVGPVLVGILTFVAQTQNLWLGFGLLFTYAVGMGQLLIILGVSSNLLYKFPKSPLIMKTAKTLLGIALITSGLFYLSLVWPKSFGGISKGPVETQGNKSPMNWQPFNEKDFAAALKSNKPILIDFFAEWCLACKELDSNTFSNSEIGAFSQNFVVFKFDATEESELLNRLKQQYNIVGLPTILFFNTQGAWIKELNLNEFEKPEAFLARMKKAI